MLVIVTRPEPASSRTARRLRAMGHDVLLSPVARIVARAPERLFDVLPDATVVTSENALRAVAGHADLDALKPLPLHAVGPRTAQAACAMGFADVSAAGGDLPSLARHLAATPRRARLLHLAGRDRVGDLDALLGPEGPVVAVREVYAAEALPRLDPAAARALAEGRAGAVLHFSPRSAALFMEQIRAEGFLSIGPGVRHLCLSERVADVLLAQGVACAEAAGRPDEDTLLAILGGSG